MKKFLALLLSFVMVLSLAACGDDASEKNDNEPSTKPKTENEDSSSDDSETGNEDAAEEVEVSDDLINLLSQLTLVAPTDAIVGTGWEFSGGMVDGTEMEQADAEQTLEMYSGKLNIVFDDNENVSMIQGGGTLKGIYGLTDDENVLGLIFDNSGSELTYAGLFAEVDGTLVLMLFPDGSGKNAIYFTQISEQ